MAVATRSSRTLPQDSQMPRSEASPPQPLWMTMRGAPSGPAEWRSPQCIRAISEGQRSRPFWVRKYSWRGRAFLVGAALEDVLVDQALEAGGEDVAGDPQVGLDAREAAVAVQHVADDQQRPTLADHFERFRQRADLVRIVVVEHPCDLRTHGLHHKT